MPLSLKGKSVLVTAGPTYEPFDAVRFIGNYSSGKMGFALAETLAERGATVFLVCGPVSLRTSHPSIQCFPVQTARQMLDECLKLYEKTDGAILSAAVADYRPKSPLTGKLKRKAENLTLELEPNPDIAATLGEMKRPDQFLAGFALESHDEISNARDKLVRKNFDFIVLNSLQDKGSGFNTDTNKISIIGKDNKITSFELKPKVEAAVDIIDYLEKILFG